MAYTVEQLRQQPNDNEEQLAASPFNRPVELLARVTAAVMDLPRQIEKDADDPPPEKQGDFVG